MYLRVREPVPELGLQLAELLVGPEDEGRVEDAGAPQPQDEHVVSLRGVPLLDVVHRDLLQATVRGLPGGGKGGVLLVNVVNSQMLQKKGLLYRDSTAVLRTSSI